ncbi:hypothetical protein FEE95_09325 [Maribacter algarum]|uniref:Uncharacterized protein n=1 Tax=Maribacter algarum (ex Zhang et al. 2020) TaxID=2578118 RepID=A0A5S3PPT1_9FLAO|nr:hypothetical protein [Maribacter algarum]TMM56694.1 hypothetical protein FEE95_09325 [Maribacter algarum]
MDRNISSYTYKDTLEGSKYEIRSRKLGVICTYVSLSAVEGHLCSWPFDSAQDDTMNKKATTTPTGHDSQSKQSTNIILVFWSGV